MACACASRAGANVAVRSRKIAAGEESADHFIVKRLWGLAALLNTTISLWQGRELG
jgi:hypothetical protein